MPRTERKTPTRKTKTAAPKTDPAQAITEEIIALIEAGTVPWQQPWFSVGAPRRHEGTPYRGINAFLLGLRAGVAGHGSPYWMTFKQAKDLGACVRKGERSSLVVYYGSAKAKGREGAEPNPAGGCSRSDEAAGDAGADGGAYRFLKSYRVFNADQIEGLDATYHPEPDRPDGDAPDPLPRWQRFFDAIGAGSGIPTDFGGDRACYMPTLDRVSMPGIERFTSAGQFYSTWWHELTHATKAEDRLDRSFGTSRFGNKAYAKEEAVAALSQCLADQLMGFGTAHIDNHAAYIDSWLKVLRGDKRFLFAAAAHAQRAVDWLVEAAARGGVAIDDAGWDPIPAQAAGRDDQVAA
jgi:antirestriction protein ArdC